MGTLFFYQHHNYSARPRALYSLDPQYGTSGGQMGGEVGADNAADAESNL